MLARSGSIPDHQGFDRDASPRAVRALTLLASLALHGAVIATALGAGARGSAAARRVEVRLVQAARAPKSPPVPVEPRPPMAPEQQARAPAPRAAPRAPRSPPVPPSAPPTPAPAPPPVPARAAAPADTGLTFEGPAASAASESGAPSGARGGDGEAEAGRRVRERVLAPSCDEPPSKPAPAARPTDIVYPPESRATGVEGRLVLKISVGEDGTVTGVEVVSGVEPALDASAVNAVRTWRFTPARRCGQAVASTYTLARRFELGD